MFDICFRHIINQSLTESAIAEIDKQDTKEIIILSYILKEAY